MNIVFLAFKAVRKLCEIIRKPIYTPVARLSFFLNGVLIGDFLNVNGFVSVYVTRRGRLNIGDYFSVNSGDNHNVIGRQQKCIFWVEGELNIGNNVGISSTAIICHNNITIGNNVMIGGNTVIYDTDFHHINPEIRNNSRQDKILAKKLPVIIGNNVFIGAHTTILKGVTIGDNAVVGACSVITRNIPNNQVWAGNPARYIKDIK